MHLKVRSFLIIVSTPNNLSHAVSVVFSTAEVIQLAAQVQLASDYDLTMDASRSCHKASIPTTRLIDGCAERQGITATLRGVHTPGAHQYLNRFRA